MSQLDPRLVVGGILALCGVFIFVLHRLRPRPFKNFPSGRSVSFKARPPQKLL